MRRASWAGMPRNSPRIREAVAMECKSTCPPETSEVVKTGRLRCNAQAAVPDSTSRASSRSRAAVWDGGWARAR